MTSSQANLCPHCSLNTFPSIHKWVLLTPSIHTFSTYIECNFNLVQERRWEKQAEPILQTNTYLRQSFRFLDQTEPCAEYKSQEWESFSSTWMHYCVISCRRGSLCLHGLLKIKIIIELSGLPEDILYGCFFPPLSLKIFYFDQHCLLLNKWVFCFDF